AAGIKMLCKFHEAGVGHGMKGILRACGRRTVIFLATESRNRHGELLVSAKSYRVAFYNQNILLKIVESAQTPAGFHKNFDRLVAVVLQVEGDTFSLVATETYSTSADNFFRNG